MAIQLTKPMTVAEFDDWVRDQTDDYEYVGGEIFTVVSNNYCSMIAARLLTFVGMYLLSHDVGYVTGSDGGYWVNGERYIPDVGFISKAAQPLPSHESYNPNPPELAVEVISPTDKERTMLVKLSNYLAAGTQVWVVYPDEREVHVHHPGKGATILTVDDTISGDDLLPGFELRIRDIFPDSEEAT